MFFCIKWSRLEDKIENPAGFQMVKTRWATIEKTDQK
jgi:hypothetical protein